MRLTVSRITLVASLTFGVACASTGSSAKTGVASSSPDLITGAEISATQSTNAYELIQRLRPRWLQAQVTGSLAGGGRTQIIAVYMDGLRVGAQEGLRSISSNGILKIQYYDAARAATILRDVGSEPIAGAIVISTMRNQ